MDWIWIALLSAVSAGLVGILDKTLVHHFATSRLTLPLLIGLGQSVVGSVLLAVVPWGSPGPDAIGWALLSGVLWGGSALLVFYVLFDREVSRTMPVFQTFPVFVAPMAVVFLDERLAPQHWAAIVAAVAGAVLISMRRSERHGGMAVDRGFYVLIGASFLAAVATITSKLAVDALPVLQTHGFRMLGLAGVLLLAGLRPAPMRDVIGFFRRRSPALALFGFNEFVVANGAMLLMLWAISLGPVSLVTAINATSSLFLVIYGVLLAMRFPGALGEQVPPSAVAIKVLSTALIVASVATIAWT